MLDGVGVLVVVLGFRKYAPQNKKEVTTIGVLFLFHYRQNTTCPVTLLVQRQLVVQLASVANMASVVGYPRCICAGIFQCSSPPGIFLNFWKLSRRESPVLFHRQRVVVSKQALTQQNLFPSLEPRHNMAAKEVSVNKKRKAVLGVKAKAGGKAKKARVDENGRPPFAQSEEANSESLSDGEDGGVQLHDEASSKASRGTKEDSSGKSFERGKRRLD